MESCGCFKGAPLKKVFSGFLLLYTLGMAEASEKSHLIYKPL